MKRCFVKTMLVCALPLMLPWAFVSKLTHEIGMAFWYAWQEVRIEFESFQRLMRKANEL
jgi:hypothetical protein